MTSLRIEKKDIYRVEVNDDKEYIEFDLADINLKAKCFQALDRLDEIADEYQEKFKEVKTEKDVSMIESSMFKDMRTAMDVFLGEGACQKIFGDRNYYDMFNDLFDELNKKRPELKGKSHMDMLNLSAERIRNRIVKKYAKTDKKVL